MHLLIDCSLQSQTLGVLQNDTDSSLNYYFLWEYMTSNEVMGSRRISRQTDRRDFHVPSGSM